MGIRRLVKHIYRRNRSHVTFSRYCDIKTKIWKWPEWRHSGRKGRGQNHRQNLRFRYQIELGLCTVCRQHSLLFYWMSPGTQPYRWFSQYALASDRIIFCRLFLILTKQTKNCNIFETCNHRRECTARLAMATFWHTFRHDGNFSPCLARVGGGFLSFDLPSRAKL